MKLTDKQLEDLRNIVAIQGNNGNWNYDPYMHGMFNGMELMLATIEDREPDFRKAPGEWLSDKPTGEHNASRELAQGSPSTSEGSSNEDS